jgi:hypothetical protein
MVGLVLWVRVQLVSSASAQVRKIQRIKRNIIEYPSTILPTTHVHVNYG